MKIVCKMGLPTFLNFRIQPTRGLALSGQKCLVILQAGLAGVLCSGINGVLYRGTLAYFRRDIYFEQIKEYLKTNSAKLYTK